MIRITVEGRPGVGKTTITRAIERLLQSILPDAKVVVFDTDMNIAPDAEELGRRLTALKRKDLNIEIVTRQNSRRPIRGT